MTYQGKRKKHVQTYICENNHFFKEKDIPRWDDTFIEVVVYTYLRCLSLNTTIGIIRMFYREDILTKGLILDFIEGVADVLPTIDDIDNLYDPIRSGYLAFDGVWFHFAGEQIVLLVCFDPETYDVVSAIWSEDETQEAYEELMRQAVNKIGAVNVKGLYADGDKGFLAVWKRHLPKVPFQLCVFHKELRMGQIVPVKSIHVSKQMTDTQKHEMRVFQHLFREVIYAPDKKTSVEELKRLKQYVSSNQHQYEERFLKAYRSLIHNFKYTLTHFDHEHMKRDNNIIEGFNSIIKPRLKLMKGFKKKKNLDRYLKLFLLEYRFRPLKESHFKDRNGNSQLEIADANIPKNYNFLTLLRNELRLSFLPKIS